MDAAACRLAVETIKCLGNKNLIPLTFASRARYWKARQAEESPQIEVRKFRGIGANENSFFSFRFILPSLSLSLFHLSLSLRGIPKKNVCLCECEMPCEGTKQTTR